MKKAIFLDRDGTIIAGIPYYERVDSIDEVKLLPNTLKGLAVLSELDFLFLIVTNQAGIAEGLITQSTFNQINDEVIRLIEPSGIHITETFMCPHGENSGCDCRKPKPKLLNDAADKYDIELADSWIIGDRITDVQTGINAGTKSILVKTGTATEAPGATYVAADLLDAANFIVKQEILTRV